MARSGAGRRRTAPLEYAPDIKAAAVAEVLAGASVHSVAKKYGTGTTTLRRWRGQSGLGGYQGPPSAEPTLEPDPQTQKDYAALVLRHLELGLAAAERILEQTANAGWLGEQSAGELATFYGVIFDKQARILSALPAPGDPGADAVDVAGTLVDAARGADPTSVEYRPG